VQVPLQQAGGDGLGRPLLLHQGLARRAAVARLLLVQRRQQLEGDHQEVPRPAGRVQQLHLAQARRGLLRRILRQVPGHPVLPALLLLQITQVRSLRPRQGHQRFQVHLSRLALRPPLGPGGLQAVQRALRPPGAALSGLHHLRRPAVPGADAEPHLPQAVLQQPLHHVAVGEQLRFGGELVVLDLPAVSDFLVQGLAVGVVPELVDPTQGGVVGPGRGQSRVLQGLDGGPQGGGRHGHQARQSHLAEQARQVQGPLFEDQAQQLGVALGVVDQQRRGEGPELTIAGALPAARKHLDPHHVQGLRLAQHHQPVQHGGRGGLDGPRQVPLPGLGRGLLGPPGAAPGLFVQPGLQPASSPLGLFTQARLLQGQRQPVGGLHRVAQVLQQPLPQGPYHRRQARLGLGGKAGGLGQGGRLGRASGLGQGGGQARVLLHGRCGAPSTPRPRSRPRPPRFPP